MATEAPNTTGAAGTRGTFEYASDEQVCSKIKAACKHYPVLVTLNGKTVQQEDFLAGSIHRKQVGRMRIGVSRRPLREGRYNSNRRH